MEAQISVTMRPLITLLTDFGTADGYVGEMKGLLLSLVADAELVDITHDIAAQDVHAARLTVARVWRRFPSGTVHIVVVDPGVGSARAGLAVESDGHALVGPDNGVLSPALLVSGARVVELPIPASASATFHARDVFVPAAAALANGESIDALGAEAREPMILRTPESIRAGDGTLVGEVIHVDRFGNAVTNLIGLRGGTIEIGSTQISVRRTYAEVSVGSLVAVVGSSGFIEIAMRDGDAAQQLRLTRGARVLLRTSR